MKKALIYISAIAFAVLLGYGISHAETTAYLTFESAGAGYDSGIGARLEHTQRWGWFGLHGMGRYALQHKQGADSGYTYAIRSGLVPAGGYPFIFSIHTPRCFTQFAVEKFRGCCFTGD